MRSWLASRDILVAMRSALLSLHGFTMNGSGLRRILGGLEARLAESVELVFPDAPHTASEASVAALAERMGGPRAAPPNLEWWNSSDDGRNYQGWQASRDRLRQEVERHPAAGLLGFSQGAAVAAAIAALSCQGAFPPLRFVVLVAGFTPRALDLQPFFATPLELPSLHVWGEADAFAKHGPGLAERFDSRTRQVVTWPGGHNVPTRGNAADVLVEFVRSHA
jgi:pimeloyl-ACP methyl ester carboxylesterase